MGRTIFFDSQCGIDRYAMREDGKLLEYRAEPVAEGAVVGNVYKGRITDVLSGMQAAFVDCGLERHCYLSASDIGEAVREANAEIPKILNLKVGDEIIVQVTKPAAGKKGARVTTNVSFVGKYAVYMPQTPFVGVSAKIDDEELRDNLIFMARKKLKGREGMIIRTAAPYAELSSLTSELAYFRALWTKVSARFAEAPCGELLYSDAPLHLRVLRDCLLRAGDEIHVGNDILYESVTAVVNSTIGRDRVKICAHDSHTDLFFTEGIEDEYEKSLMREVPLSNGAYLVVDRTEALTVIDVNTGKFTGEDSLEDTVYSTNVLAAHEIARQVRLRNLGGIFVVDFIDMAEEKHRKAIATELERALKKDGSKCRVLPMSKIGLIEFTRKRTGASTDEQSLKRCRHCNGSGSVRSTTSILTEFRAKLLSVLSDGTTTVCADLNFDIANALAENEQIKANVAELYPQARIYIVSHRTYREDAMYFRKVDAKEFSLPAGTTLLY